MILQWTESEARLKEGKPVKLIKARFAPTSLRSMSAVNECVYRSSACENLLMTFGGLEGA